MSTSGGVSAEQYALGLLRRNRDSMTRPNFQQVADDSALTVEEVVELWEKLLADRAPKPLARTHLVPAAASPGVHAVPDVRPGEVQSWQAAKDHPSARIRRKYNTAVQAIAALEGAMARDAAQAKLRAKEARLRAELEKTRRELAGNPQKAPCPECGTQIGLSAQARAVHLARSQKHKAGGA